MIYRYGKNSETNMSKIYTRISCCLFFLKNNKPLFKKLFQLFRFRFQYLIFPFFLNCIGCKSDFDCTNNAQCGTDRTCRCRQGFEPKGALCIDVNECQKQPDICGPFATCTNTQGGYDCRCQPPLTGNPPLEPCKGK